MAKIIATSKNVPNEIKDRLSKANFNVAVNMAEVASDIAGGKDADGDYFIVLSDSRNAIIKGFIGDDQFSINKGFEKCKFDTRFAHLKRFFNTIEQMKIDDMYVTDNIFYIIETIIVNGITTQVVVDNKFKEMIETVDAYNKYPELYELVASGEYRRLLKMNEFCPYFFQNYIVVEY